MANNNEMGIGEVERLEGQLEGPFTDGELTALALATQNPDFHNDTRYEKSMEKALEKKKTGLFSKFVNFLRERPAAKSAVLGMFYFMGGEAAFAGTNDDGDGAFDGGLQVSPVLNDIPEVEAVSVEVFGEEEVAEIEAGLAAVGEIQGDLGIISEGVDDIENLDAATEKAYELKESVIELSSRLEIAREDLDRERSGRVNFSGATQEYIDEKTLELKRLHSQALELVSQYPDIDPHAYNISDADLAEAMGISDSVGTDDQSARAEQKDESAASDASVGASAISEESTTDEWDDLMKMTPEKMVELRDYAFSKGVTPEQWDTLSPLEINKIIEANSGPSAIDERVRRITSIPTPDLPDMPTSLSDSPK